MVAHRANAQQPRLLRRINLKSLIAVGLVRTVVSISHCGCDDPGSIPGLDSG